MIEREKESMEENKGTAASLQEETTTLKKTAATVTITFFEKTSTILETGRPLGHLKVLLDEKLARVAKDESFAQDTIEKCMERRNQLMEASVRLDDRRKRDILIWKGEFNRLCNEQDALALQNFINDCLVRLCLEKNAAYDENAYMGYQYLCLFYFDGVEGGGDLRDRDHDLDKYWNARHTKRQWSNKGDDIGHGMKAFRDFMQERVKDAITLGLPVFGTKSHIWMVKHFKETVLKETD